MAGKDRACLSPVLFGFELGLETSMIFLRLGGMDRIELIAKLAKRKGLESGYVPRGMAHPGKQAVPKPIDRVRTSGITRYGSWGPINRPAGLKYDWVHEKDASQDRPLKHGHRHTKHVLNVIAERLRRR